MRFLLPLLLILTLLAGGCASSPEDRVIGVWIAVPEETFIPPVPLPDLERQIRRYMRNLKVKLRSDKTFVVSSGAAVEGKWRLDGDRLILKRDKGGLEGPMGVTVEEMGGTVDFKKQRLTIEIPTPVGPLLIGMRKTA